MLAAEIGWAWVVCEGQTSMHRHTGEVRKINSNKGTLWANVLGIFSEAPAHS